MNTFAKIDAIKSLADKLNLSQQQSEAMIDTFLGDVETALSRGDRVEFRGFGIWEVRVGKERVGRNPANPEAGSIHIPARRVVKFKVGKNLKAAVAGQPT